VSGADGGGGDRGGQDAEPDSGRTCYDHLDVDTLRGGIRPLIRYCVDWSEQVEHVHPTARRLLP